MGLEISTGFTTEHRAPSPPGTQGAGGQRTASGGGSTRVEFSVWDELEGFPEVVKFRLGPGG